MKQTNGIWLAAVSGGPDSMALLAWCMEKGIPVAAAHVNYHHRAQAEEEEAYVRTFCRERGIVLHVMNDPFEAEGNFEARAREHRYAFFAQTVREYGYRGVLVGHHQDDAIETYLMQKEKNLVPDYYGLRRERMINGVWVVRPLLSFTRKELRQYCDIHGIRYYIDHTNADLSYARNRIRAEHVEGMDSFTRQMLAAEMEKENAVLQERRCRVSARIHQGEADLMEYRNLKEEDRLTLLRQIGKAELAHAGLAWIREIDSVIMKKQDTVIPCGNHRIAVDGERIFLQRIPAPYRHACRNPEEILALKSPYFRTEPGKPGVNAVTVSEKDFPIIVRSVENGDRIAMRFGTKRVHRFFIDRHIPICQRDTWPVVENAAGEIILVPGLGCDKSHYSIRPDFSVIQYSH